jgi:hypothetical protein
MPTARPCDIGVGKRVSDTLRSFRILSGTLTFLWTDHENLVQNQLRAPRSLCPGLEQDSWGEWHYVPRWWALCHMWIGEFGVHGAQ